MKEEQLDGRGMSVKELQNMIDTAVIRRNKPTKHLLEDLERNYLRLAELLPDFSKKMLEVIKKHHPSLIKKT
jgi:hypothetical protein